MLVKIHKTPDGRRLLTLCDNDLLGKKFEDQQRQLDISVSFYGGNERKEEDIKKLIKGAYILNVVGRKSIDFCIEQGVISTENIITVQNIPHAQTMFD